MQGKVLGFTRSTGTGTITGEDGRRYGFVRLEWRSDDPVCAGAAVDFEVRGEEALGIYPLTRPPRLVFRKPTPTTQPKGHTMATKLGTVNVIWRTLDIYGFTGEIMETQRTSETTVTGNFNTPNAQISSRTDHYNHLFLRNAAGDEIDLNIESRTGFRAGQTATAIWASSAGPDKGKYIAVYNNTTRQMNTVRKGNNDMAGIPFYNYIGVLAVFVGVFGFMAHGVEKLFWCGLGFGYIAFMMLCQKRLMDGAAALMRDYTPE